MQISHSRVECFNSCPYRYDLRYNQEIKTIPPDNADNALFLGTALHTGIEKDVNAAIWQYFMSYPVISDNHINEAMKLEDVIPKAKAMCPPGEHEVKIDDPDFIGFIDLLAPVKSDTRLGGDYQDLPGVYDLYDFKYSNNVSHYMESPQLHLYKYFYEKQHPGHKIRKLFFLFVPKLNIRQKKTENLFEFRQRILEGLKSAEPKLVEIEYDQTKVIEFLLMTKKVLEAKDYEKEPSWLCNYCEYNDYCQKGINYMNLPSTERRQVGQTTKRKIWIYGGAFSGKTTMLDDAPNPLNLNTDGNIQFVTMPYMAIKDEVTVNGRMTNRKFAWEVFKETIAELEKKQNDFKTIIIDLLEDTREMCRIYKYDEMGIQHESDSGFGKGWDIIKTEYLSTMRRFFNLDYENLVVVSHEVKDEVKKKNGTVITTVYPNLQDKISNKIAGMVDMVARVVVEDDGRRTLNFKADEFVFGGGRLKGITKTSIPLSWDALMEVYDEVNEGRTASTEATQSSSRRKASNSSPATETATEQATEEAQDDVQEEAAPQEAPKTRTRTRKRRDSE